ncbi:putative transcription factor tfiiic complex subunit protein [Eutypa lata UCREL1]|uniref:Putative transcription factor tfiiic complex subunit protein n=1 Tax=Eutypa lata (strain UCR-EL1) TaxID=1287681 RepID=M7SW65_EUTLA|nr:putative transcription factor tfiiic complex subunit protein [Eutypa lata UCREL1]
MRLRRSNQRKRFRPSDLNLRLGISDEDEETTSQGNDESHDEGFVDDGELELDAEHETDEDLAESSGIESSIKEVQTPKHKKTNIHQAPEQPPLWWEYQMLPPKLTSKYDIRVAANPWMPDGFPEDEEVKFRQWYERYLEKRTRQFMSSSIDRGKAFRWFIPQAADDLTVIIGDVTNQKEHRFKQGQAMPFSGLGNPIEDTDNGKMGSIVPFADQAFYQDIRKAPKESEKREGAVQIWRFEADEDNKCLVHPAQRPPTLVLQRHPIHLSPIIDIASGYPSHPFIVATIPVGGVFTLTDLNRPNQEMAYNPNLSVCTQPNLLSWSEILRGYMLIWPSAFAGNSAIAFEHVRVFAQGRYIMTLDSQPTCLSIGKCHPCVLVGTTDGSLWAVNIMKKAYSHREASSKLKLFRHEYRAANPGVGLDGGEEEIPRGKCRVLHGFLPERNLHPKATRLAAPQKAKAKSSKKKKKKSKGKGKEKKKEAPGGDGSEDGSEDDDLSDAMGELDAEAEEEGPGAVPQPIVVHDAQTRITHVAWSPNVRFSWWAAAAMGSGLVRVMDLGIDQPRAGGAAASSDGSSENEDHDDDEGDEVKDESDGLEDEEDEDEDEDEDSESDVEMADGDGDGDVDTTTTTTPRTRSRWRSVNK